MEQGYKHDDLPSLNKTGNLKLLYDQYADKLLGYILAIVNNRLIAEDCVVKIFTEISSSTKAQPGTYSNTWNWLMTLAQNEINKLSNAADECKSVTENTAYVQAHKYLARMTETQRLVFCGMYYHRKTTVQLAKELSLPEQVLKLKLKEAFMIIREVKDEN